MSKVLSELQKAIPKQQGKVLKARQHTLVATFGKNINNQYGVYVDLGDINLTIKKALWFSKKANALYFGDYINSASNIDDIKLRLRLK